MGNVIGVIGASGELGRLVLPALQARGVAAKDIVALVRDPAKLADFAAAGGTVRAFDYDGADLAGALAGIDRLLLISSPTVGKRLEQHERVIAAAKAAGTGFIAYTSILRADTSPISLAPEHVGTEKALTASGIPHVLLRNGWYLENYAGNIPAGVAHGAIVASDGNGRINAATRADFAEAAAVVLTGGAEAGAVLELAGDEAFTQADFAAELAAQSGKPVVYKDIPEADYAKLLESFGLPAGFAAVLAQASAATAGGALAEDGKALSRLIGHPTTGLKAFIAGVLAAQG